MTDELKPSNPKTLKDGEITTEGGLHRRSFLAATGALLVGAAALASGVRAMAQSAPDQKKKRTDPDQKKGKRTDPDQKKHKRTDPDQKKGKRTDPDQKKKKAAASDPDAHNRR